MSKPREDRQKGFLRPALDQIIDLEHQLGPAVAEIEALTGVEARCTHVDKGYRGHSYPNRFGVWISGHVRRVTQPIRREMKHCAAIELVIGHMKAEHCMGRNDLPGREGDRANAVLAADGYKRPRSPEMVRGPFASPDQGHPHKPHRRSNGWKINRTGIFTDDETVSNRSEKSSIFREKVVPPGRIELPTPPLPRECSTPELRRRLAGGRPCHSGGRRATIVVIRLIVGSRVRCEP